MICEDELNLGDVLLEIRKMRSGGEYIPSAL